jgi:hypothetical protein
MKHAREQKRAKLLVAAQAAIEELLDWEEQADRPKLTDIETEVLALRERFGLRMAEVVITDQDAKQPVATAECPSCGQPMRYKGQKGLGVESQVSLLSVDRGHYYCARCHSGLFPPG